MRLEEFDYELPEELIAQVPLDDRSASRLLHLDKITGEIFHRSFTDCIDLLEPGDVLVVNETRVTAIRLYGKKSTGAEVELLLLEPFSSGKFWCLARPGRRLNRGSRIEFEGGLQCEVLDVDSIGRRLVDFSNTPQWESILALVGQVPLPPYIQTQLEDGERYQTVYSHGGGSAAAPTAGLHFTQALLDRILAKGIEIAKVSLDVSLDTFRPVNVENIEDHKIHGETCRVSEIAAETINGRKGRVIAVGTTSVRTLETFANSTGTIESGETRSEIFITPGYSYKLVDGMFTNFHLPKTTMLMMISAMAGQEPVINAYREAVLARYRFLSFGDSMLIL